MLKIDDSILKDPKNGKLAIEFSLSKEEAEKIEKEVLKRQAKNHKKNHKPEVPKPSIWAIIFDYLFNGAMWKR